jgi:hypothetical protein
MVWQNVSVFLSCLRSHVGDLRKEILEAGFVRSLLKHLESDDCETQESAIDTLSDLTKYRMIRPSSLMVVLTLGHRFR